MPEQPLPAGFTAAEPFIAGATGSLTAGEFGAAVAAAIVAAPAGPMVNLCEDRASFLAGFAAAVSQGRTTLLPASRAAAAIAELVEANPDSALLDDRALAAIPPAAARIVGTPAADFTAAVAYTSGTTGKPGEHAKTWSGFIATTRLNAAAIRARLDVDGAASRPWIVATVPAQHMYGLETTVLLPLLGGFGIHRGRPLLPADVAAALDQVPAPRVLVSTPLHLRALVESGVRFPRVAVVVSATAPLSQDLARRVEQTFGASLLEMFGATETCVFATRLTARQTRWRPYAGVRLTPTTDDTLLDAPWLPGGRRLLDIVELHADGLFTVLGRSSDLVEVAGKRASIADLTRRIGALNGVRDVVVFQPDAPETGAAQRLVALVVAPGLEARDILARLRPSIDPAFLPRPLLVVPELPRNDVGKLPRARLHAVLRLAGEESRGVADQD